MSKILTGNQAYELIELFEFNHDKNFELLYRATRDGFGSKNFHSKCDGKSNTLTIFKTTGTSFIFGGYTTASWESCEPGKYKSDPNAFLFSLTNGDNKPCKLKIDKSDHAKAIYCGSNCGPSFG
jgi:hypothetical protein